MRRITNNMQSVELQTRNLIDDEYHGIEADYLTSTRGAYDVLLDVLTNGHPQFEDDDDLVITAQQLAVGTGARVRWTDWDQGPIVVTRTTPAGFVTAGRVLPSGALESVVHIDEDLKELDLMRIGTGEVGHWAIHTAETLLHDPRALFLVKPGEVVDWALSINSWLASVQGGSMLR